MKYFVNTDTVNMRNKQIGIHTYGGEKTDREFCAGVNHNGTKASVQEATRIARIMAASPDMLEALILAEELLNKFAPGDAYLERGEISKAICKALDMNYQTVKTAVYDQKVKKARAVADA